MFDVNINDSLLFWASPGVECEPFMFELLNNHLSSGFKAVLCVTDKSFKTLINESSEYGYEFEKHVDKSLFTIELMDKTGINDVKKNIKKEVARLGGNLLVCFNNISTLIDKYGTEAIKTLSFMSRFIKQKKGKSVYLFTEWPYDSEVITIVKDSFKSRIYLNAVSEGGITRKYYSISDGDNFKHVLFNVAKPGGVINVDPKVIVVDSGKTSFIQSLSERSISVDYLSEGFGIDYGVFNYEGFNVKLFGAPSDKFDSIIDLLGDELTSVMVMLDSLDPDAFIKARRVINSAKKYGLNVVVGLDNLDVEVSEIKHYLGVNEVPFVNISEDNANNDEIIRKLLNY